jgi:6-phosphogluconolactonase (cycloisomerase 2 family)
MRFERISGVAKASAVSVAMMLGLSSCSLDYVVGYVYVTAAKSTPGIIHQYSIDYQSGALTEIGTPVKAGANPVRVVAAPNGKFVYVVNQGDSTVQEFAVNRDGTLASKNTYKVTGSLPTAAAIDAEGKYLYVTFRYQAGYSAATPGPGGVTVFPINADNTLGTASTVNVGNNPVGISASYFNHFVYVLDQEASPNATILGFSENTLTGALTPVPGTTITTVAGKTAATGYPAGVVPSGIAEEQTSRFVYVTDQAANHLIGYTVSPNGALVPMVDGPFATGQFPVNLTIDPTGKLIYVVNYNANTIQGYAIDTATGTPSSSVGAFATPVGSGPTCVAIDPALGTNLYTSNNLDDTVSAEKVQVNTGGLTGVQNSPFLASGTPTCLAIVPNGQHATQIIQP